MSETDSSEGSRERQNQSLNWPGGAREEGEDGGAEGRVGSCLKKGENGVRGTGGRRHIWEGR